jgi:hypothetical protein
MKTVMIQYLANPLGGIGARRGKPFRVARQELPASPAGAAGLRSLRRRARFL